MVLLRCGVLGAAHWASRLQDGGVDASHLGERLADFVPSQHPGLPALVVSAAALAGAGARAAQVLDGLRALLPGCEAVCVCEDHEPAPEGWPGPDLYRWPGGAAALTQRLRGEGGAPAWWEAAAAQSPVAPSEPEPATAGGRHLLPPVLPPPARTPAAAAPDGLALLPAWRPAPTGADAARGHLRTGQVVSVTGAKGGVGQTWVAVNLAVSLSLLTGMECLLADLDLASADVAVYLGLIGAPTVVDIVQQRDEDGWPWRGLHQLRSCPLRVLTGPERPQMASLLEPAEVTETVLSLREQFAYTVCDQAPGDAAALAQSVPGAAVVLVTSADAPSLRQAGLRLGHLRQQGLQDRTYVVLNRTSPGGMPAADAAAYLEHGPVLEVPWDRRRLEQAVQEARPVALDTQAEQGRAFAALARAVAGLGAPGGEPVPGWRRWLEQLWKR